MASKPTIVLVHGASHTPAHFQNVISRLEKAGYEVEAPHNPSSAKVRAHYFWEAYGGKKKEEDMEEFRQAHTKI